jgi:hypothetical protein
MKTKRSNTIMNQTQRLYVSLKTAAPSFVQKNIATSTTVRYNTTKTKEPRSTGKLTRKYFRIVWNCCGERLFISRQDRASMDSAAPKIDCAWKFVGTQVLTTERRDVSLNLHVRGCLQYTLIRNNDTQKQSYQNG